MTSPYWDQFTPDFVRTADVGFADEFSRLAVQKGWKTRSDIWHKERLQCYSQEFEALYGSASHLEGWARLCAEVGETEIPVSITQAKKMLRGTCVNLVDLMECRATQKTVAVHESKKALRVYSRKTKKIFPREEAKQNGFLKVLLTEMGGRRA
ncbi:hypothetical protein HWV62_45356 [Athelia sp. TMB]|nr:hypothetical protein HWV62_45356 [Athelia sp. TMB]